MTPEEGIDGTGTQAPEKPAWIAQLPDDLKGNETFTSFKTIGDLAKNHLETLGKVKELDGKSAKVGELETRLANSIPKLLDKATDEEKVAYRKAMGVPEKPEEYEFPKGTEIEHSPEMVGWAQKVFHKFGLSKSQAAGIGMEWDGFIKGMIEAQEEAAEEAKKENEKIFRSQFKSEDEFTAGTELAKRFWKKITNTDFDEAFKEAEAWQVPLFKNFVYIAAKGMGEDWSPPGTGPGGEVMPGMIYNKSPGLYRRK